MKTNLLTVLIFAFASVLYSCSKESDGNYSASCAQDKALTTAERRIIIANCSSHAGCHSSARFNNASSLNEIKLLLKGNIDSRHNLSVCERSKLQTWLNGEAQ